MKGNKQQGSPVKKDNLEREMATLNPKIKYAKDGDLYSKAPNDKNIPKIVHKVMTFREDRSDILS